MQTETVPYAASGKLFDSLAYAKRMEAVGFTRQQAEALAEEQARLIDDRLATKTDIAMVRDDIERFKIAVAADLQKVETGLETRLETRIAETKADILKWVLGTIGLQTFVLLGGLIAIIRSMGHS